LKLFRILNNEKMAKLVYVCALLMTVCCICCIGQTTTIVQTDTNKSETKGLISPYGPTTSVRTIIQDRKGNIWLASNEGIIRYDGKSFTNVTGTLGEDRFFSILEDRNGNFWFGNFGSGAYYYNSSAGGESVKRFTTEDGLISNKIASVYEDRAGNIWFGANGGVSRYDPSAALTGGKSFRNYIMDRNIVIEDSTGKFHPNISSGSNGVYPILEDKTGKIWFGTSGNTFVCDPSSATAAAPLWAGGKKFSVVADKDGRVFTNVWSIIEDKRGNIWLGGDGLWRYNASAGGGTFTHFSDDNIRYLYEDKAGNIWGSGGFNGRWALFRFDEKALADKKPTVIEIPESLNLFGIFEANDGSIWFGSFDGVYRFEPSALLKDGVSAIGGFKRK